MKERPSQIDSSALELAKLYQEFFAPGEIERIKKRRAKLIDPLPLLARTGVVVEEENQLPLFSLLQQHSPVLRFIDTPQGVRINKIQIDELMLSSIDAYWEIVVKLIPEATRKVFNSEMATAGLEVLRENRLKRLEASERDWAGRNHSS